MKRILNHYHKEKIGLKCHRRMITHENKCNKEKIPSCQISPNLSRCCCLSKALNLKLALSAQFVKKGKPVRVARSQTLPLTEWGGGWDWKVALSLCEVWCYQMPPRLPSPERIHFLGNLKSPAMTLLGLQFGKCCSRISVLKSPWKALSLPCLTPRSKDGDRGRER